MKTTRGEFRCIFKAIHGSEKFKQLSGDGRHLFYVVKLELGASGIDCVMAYREVLMEITSLSKPRIQKALDDLVDKEFLIIDDAFRILWLRNSLLHDPHMSMKNTNQRKGILRHLRGLPERPIVRDFAAHYSLPDPFGIIKELGDKTPQEALQLDGEESGGGDEVE